MTATDNNGSNADAQVDNKKAAGKAKGDDLASKKLPELRKMASAMGIKRTSALRKGELIDAIKSHNRGGDQARKDSHNDSHDKPFQKKDNAQDSETANSVKQSSQDKQDKQDGRNSNRNRSSNNRNRSSQGRGNDSSDNTNRNDSEDRSDRNDRNQRGGGNDNRGNNNRKRRDRNRRDRNRRDNNGRPDRSDRPERSSRDERDTEIREGDVLKPVAGILDILDNYAFVRTSGYSAGPHDVYVSMNMVRKSGLRRGDAIVGAVRMPRDKGQQAGRKNRQKFNPLVRIDSINGLTPEAAAQRPDFSKLIPLYPNQRLRLETTQENITTRLIDLIMPIGKGQRALIVSPPKAGKTTILQNIANAITTNYPECHLMVVLVDERPEEVTDMQRSVKGEVISSTFDCPPSNHTNVSELAIERAKRLVEQGMDVVVLLDSITRLGRAYNNSSPASGRILSGGVDSTALYPPKRFLGAARNIENGGSLTIIATAMVETGSAGDTVIFEEFKGTGNAELKLDRKIAERRIFPAIDINPSGTRKDELLLGKEEYQIVHKFRRVLSGLEPIPAIELVNKQLRKTKNNREFLMQIAKTTPNMDEEA